MGAMQAGAYRRILYAITYESRSIHVAPAFLSTSGKLPLATPDRNRGTYQHYIMSLPDITTCCHDHDQARFLRRDLPVLSMFPSVR